MPVFHLLPRAVAALALALAPILPGIATADRAHASDEHAMHSAHAGGHAHAAPQVGPTDDAPPCGQHESCDGQCCATCVQCFTGTLPPASASAESRTVQTPTVRTLLDSLFVTLLNRPPSAA